MVKVIPAWRFEPIVAVTPINTVSARRSICITVTRVLFIRVFILISSEEINREFFGFEFPVHTADRVFLAGFFGMMRLSLDLSNHLAGVSPTCAFLTLFTVFPFAPASPF